MQLLAIILAFAHQYWAGFSCLALQASNHFQVYLDTNIDAPTSSNLEKG